MSRIKQLGRNYQFLIFSRIISMVISFVLFPLIVSHVGKELYGAYLLGMTVNGYFGMLDLGIGSAIKKYVPEYIGRNDREGLYGIMNASFSFYVIFGLFAGGALFFISSLGPTLFKITPANEMVLRNLFWIFAVTAIFHWPLQTFNGVVQGLQRYDWISGLNIAMQIGQLGGVYLLLTRGYDIISVTILTQILILGTDLIYFMVAVYYIKGYRLKFPYFRRQVFREIFSFSIFVFLGGIAGIVIYSINDFVIGTFVSVAAIAIYKVAYAMQNIIRAINSMMGAPLMTLFAEMEGAGEHEKQRQLLLKGTKYITLSVLPLITIAIIFSEPFVLSWVGKEFKEAILPAQVLLFFWIFNVILEVGTDSLIAKGIVKPVLWILIIVAVCNFVLSLIFVRILGILGVALGLTVSMVVINFPMTLFIILKNIEVKLVELFDFSLKSSLLASLMSAVLSVITVKYFQSNNIFWILMQMACVYSIIIFFGYFFALSQAEKLDVKRMMSIEAPKIDFKISV